MTETASLRNPGSEIPGSEIRVRRGQARAMAAGFTLIELMIAVAVVGILAAIAYPSYTSSVSNSNRGAAKACLAQHANFLERFYSANLSYYQDRGGNVIGGGAAASLPALGCDTDGNLATRYTFSFSTAPTAASPNAYAIRAVPVGVQATHDAKCGTLTLNQSGTRGASGSAGVPGCW